MDTRHRVVIGALLVALLLPAAVVEAKKGQQQGQPMGQQQMEPMGQQGQQQGQQRMQQPMQPGGPQGQQQGQPYGPPGYAGPKGQNQNPPYGPPDYAGPKNGQHQGQNWQNNDMPPGQAKKQHKKAKKHGPPEHAPAWGYRNQQ